jgi:hypothetical protein
MDSCTANPQCGQVSTDSTTTAFIDESNVGRVGFTSTPSDSEYSMKPACRR